MYYARYIILPTTQRRRRALHAQEDVLRGVWGVGCGVKGVGCGLWGGDRAAPGLGEVVGVLAPYPNCANNA